MHSRSGASLRGSYDGKIAGLYDLEQTLGSGHFAVVKSARHVFTGEKVAVKVIDKTKLDEVSRAHLFQVRVRPRLCSCPVSTGELKVFNGIPARCAPVL